MRRRASASTAARSARLLTPIVTAEVVGEVGGDARGRPRAAAGRRRPGSTRPGRCRWRVRPRASASGRGVEGVGAGVDLADRELLGRGVAGGFRLDDRARRRRRRRGRCGRRCRGRRARSSSPSPRRRAARVGVEQAGDRSRRRSAGGRRRGRATVSRVLDQRRARRGSRRRCRRPRAGRRSRRPRAGRRRGRGPGETITATRPAPASRAARIGQATIGRPQTGCSTFGSEERMRVPSPAAMTRTVGRAHRGGREW